MPAPSLSWIEILRKEALTISPRSHVPYSCTPAGAVVLLSDGTLIPGVRVESASFSLTIPALLNAITTAIAYRRTDVAAVVFSGPIGDGENAYIKGLGFQQLARIAPDVFCQTDASEIPEPGPFLDPFTQIGDQEGLPGRIEDARRIAGAAYVPSSDFPVGCLLETELGFISGVNVEHEDWTRILCAERNALGTAVTYGTTQLKKMYLSCTKDHKGSPCGACRQLLAEQAPGMSILMDRGPICAPEQATPESLLPGFFSGLELRAQPKEKKD